MWLLPVFSSVARLATRTYYQLQVGGERVPARGPALLVANHPNSLLDPALVVAVAGRPVRFLAKAPLFSDPLVGWLVRGAGAIPVYRKQDDPSRMDQNLDAFAAAHRALAGGAAIGIFPEGMSHDAPSLAPLRTGAARIALGAALHHGSSFAIVPVGLVFRRKDVFRSEARVVVGAAVGWDDLARAGDTPDAVRELTARIEDGLRSVTMNLERWEDEPLVALADAIWTAEVGPPASTADGMLRLRRGTERLAEIRRAGGGDWETLARDLRRHGRILARMRLTPTALAGEARVRDAAWWTLTRLPLVLPVGVGLGLLGAFVFWPPFRVTGLVTDRMKPDTGVRSTTKLLVGIPTYLAWIVALAGVAWVGVGPGVAAVTLALLPPFAVGTLEARERWREDLRALRTFFVKRRRADLIVQLRDRQQELARRLAELMKPV